MEASGNTGPLVATRSELVVLLSGGIDSATLLALSVSQDCSVSGLFIHFGQAAAGAEERASAAVAEYYSVPLRTLTLAGLGFESGEIRARNAFLLYAALLGLGSGPRVVSLAIHAGTGYRDCSEEFLAIMSRSYDFHTGGEVSLLAPFIEWRKSAIVGLARELHVPFQLTYSCEAGDEPCGRCDSCLDREALLARA